MSAYEGQVAVIPLGKLGLFTDAPQTDIPPTGLIRAYNVSVYDNVLEKDRGSRRWNQTSFGSAVIRFAEVFLNSTTQRVYALLDNGQIIKNKSAYAQLQLTPINPAPAALNPSSYTTMLVGGNELVARPKKVFVFTGYDPVQVLSGDATQRYNVSAPASDWTGTNQPFGGVLHRGRIFAFGCENNPHQVYVSSATDHEDYTTSPLSFNVYPGESQGMVGGAVFRGRLYMFKYPTGIYQLNDSDPNSTNWFFSKYSDEFGASSPQSFAVVRNDLVIANNYGSLSTLQASLVFGDVLASDMFHTSQMFSSAEEEIRPDAIFGRNLLFNSQKATLYATFQSPTNDYNDRICVIDLKSPQSPPKITWSTKDNANCLDFISDSLYRRQPCYGANDGYIYQMDQADRWVGDIDVRGAYTMDAMTPHIDFGQGSPIIAEQNKNFDFLEVVYEATGNFNVNLDVFIDSKYSDTYLCDLSGRSNLDEFKLSSTTPLDGSVPFTRRFKIGGWGRRIAVRMYNSIAGENVRIVALRIYYRLSGQQQTVR